MTLFHYLFKILSQHLSCRVVTIYVFLLAGLTVIYKRRNSAYLDIQTAESALSELGPGTGPGPAERPSTGTALPAVYLNAELRQRVLNLMRFEDLHDWLAPTGNISSLFGIMLCFVL